MQHNHIYIGTTQNKGRGIFTEAAIGKNSVVEVAPVIVMSHDDRQLLDRTLLHDYIFEWTPGDVKKCCMALGYVPIYNHAYASNCEYFMDYDTETILVKAIRHIEAGEELTINYNGDWNDETPVWFDVND